jgi:hypothetical protein
MNTLNNSAHASLATVVTCIDFSKNRESRRPIVEKHVEYWKLLCDNLDYIENAFKVGKTRKEALAEFKKPQASRTTQT